MCVCVCVCACVILSTYLKFEERRRYLRSLHFLEGIGLHQITVHFVFYKKLLNQFFHIHVSY